MAIANQPNKIVCHLRGGICERQDWIATDGITAFLAYASSPNSVADIMRTFATKINSGGTWKIVDWSKLTISGSLVFCEICRQLRGANALIADVTTINMNVMFEMGYAIGLGKSLWVIRDDTLTYPTIYDLPTFKTLGYQKYQNSNALELAFYAKPPFERTLDPSVAEPLSQGSKVNGARLFFLKTTHQDDIALAVADTVNDNIPSVLIDDSTEAYRSLSWYLSNIASSENILFHLAGNMRRNSRLHNARSAFFAGVSSALGKRILMLKEADDEPVPIDYHDGISIYTNKRQALASLNEWLLPIVDQIQEEKRIQRARVRRTAQTRRLAQVDFGDIAAEYETEDLEKYFITTDEFTQALEGRQSFFVGRKGTGKTANFLMLHKKLDERPNDLVCILKPEGYELDEFERLAQHLHAAEHGMLLNAFWKYVLYTELINAIISHTKVHPQSGMVVEPIKAYWNQHRDELSHSFASRLMTTVERIAAIKSFSSPSEQKSFIIEKLHTEHLKELEPNLITALASFTHVYVLIDNLDKNWVAGKDTLEVLCKLLIELMTFSLTTMQKFKSRGANLHVVLYIRSDIIRTLRKSTNDIDKHPLVDLEWTPGMLTFLLARRIEESLGVFYERPEDAWDAVFDGRIGSFSTAQYMVSRTLNRPRDLLEFARQALEKAKNNGHEKITATDVLEAESAYSEYMFWTLIKELSEVIPNPEEVLWAFLQKNSSIRDDQLDEILEEVCSKRQDTTIANIRHALVVSGFLGFRIESNRLVFAYQEDPFKAERMAINHAKKSGVPGKLYGIHPAYHKTLYLDDKLG